MRRHRAALAANLALVVTTGLVVAYAVSADGYQSHRTELNDGGIWVTSSADGLFGRINKPIGQADGAMFADADDNLDIVQQGAGVVGVNLTDNLVTSIDPALVQAVEGEEAIIAPGAQVVMGGGSVAVLDPQDGRVWAGRFDPDAGRASVAPLAEGADPRATVGATAALTVTTGGAVLAASADEDRVLRIAPRGQGFAEPVTENLSVDIGTGLQMTSVGERGVLLDGETGDLVVVDGGTASLPPGSVLQQPGPVSDSVLVSTRTELLEVDLETGDATAVAAGPLRPADRAGAPRRLRVRRLVGRARRGRDRLRGRRAAYRLAQLRRHRPRVPRQPRGDPPQRPRERRGLEPRLRRTGPHRRLGGVLLRHHERRPGGGRGDRGRGRPAAPEGQARRLRRPARPDHRPAPPRQRHRADGPDPGHPLAQRGLRAR